MVLSQSMRRDPSEPLARLRARFGAFIPMGTPSWSIKTVVFPGELAGQPAVAKVLERDLPVWRWYLQREIGLYQSFAKVPLPVRAPRLLDADPEHAILIEERLPGAALAQGRAAPGPIGAQALGALLEASEKLNAWSWAHLPRFDPPAEAHQEMRRRLLEDPTAPMAWFLEGIDRCVQLNLLSAPEAKRMRAGLEDSAIATCHGDMLLRNALWDGEDLRLIDWECMGPHPAHWDRAILWPGLVPVEQDALEVYIDKHHRATRSAFYATVAWALARELKFSRGKRHRAYRDAMDQVQAKLQEALERS